MKFAKHTKILGVFYDHAYEFLQYIVGCDVDVIGAKNELKQNQAKMSER
jgi:hypothetical protein